MDKRIGFGFLQSCRSKGSVGRVSGFGLRWCVWGVGMGLGPGSGRLRWCVSCVSV